MQNYIYITYNQHCDTCMKLANLIHVRSQGRIILLPMHSQLAVELLSKALPLGWKMVPYLIECNGQSVVVKRSVFLLMRLILVIGTINTFRIIIDMLLNNLQARAAKVAHLKRK